MIDRDRLIEFSQTHRKIFVVATICLLIILLFVLVIILYASETTRKIDEKKILEQKNNSLYPEELWLPLEHLSVPGVQLFREPHSRWTAEDVGQWYTAPDEDSMRILRTAGRKQIDILLESVP